MPPPSSVGDSTECIPGFKADDRVMLDRRVVVGASHHETPEFQSAAHFADDRVAQRTSSRANVCAGTIVGAQVWNRFATFAALVGFGFISTFAPPTAHAANPPKDFDEKIAQEYARVTNWQGFWESTETRAFSKTNAMGYTRKAYEATSHGRFELTRGEVGWAPEIGNFSWTGSGDATGRTSETQSIWERHGARRIGHDWQISSGGHGTSRQIEFTLWMGRQHASLHAGTGTEKVAPTRKVGHGINYLGHSRGQDIFKEVTYDKTWYAPIQQFFVPNYEKETKNWVVARGGPGVLVFEREEHHHVSVGGLRRSRVVLYPVYDDLEVEVTIEGTANERPAGATKTHSVSYEEWRPKGSIADPSKPGNALAARAVLKSKDGKTKDLPEVELFRFELIDTSREPGVCMNWPLAAKDEDYDLKFADLRSGNPTEQLAAVRKFFADWGMTSSGDYDQASMPAGGVPRFSFAEVAEDGQRAELIEPPQDPAGRPFAEVAIECFDFGAKAELRVTCILKDGRELLGLIKSGDGGPDLVRLPKRAGPDWIAEKWRKDNDVVGLAASDDNEKVDGQPHNGDGFTLYEEYRGWVENGKHIEGDPKRKDFFVLNLVGADARRGIRMLEAAAQLRVIDRLRPTEMSKEHRLMNGNHRDAPHRVDQHGVWIEAFGAGEIGSHGAATGLRESGKSGRPGITTGIGMPTRLDTTSDFNKPFNLPRSALATAYDRAVAHELAHALGALHHGAGDFSVSVRYLPADDSNNPLQRPGLFADVDGKMVPVRVLDERSRQDILGTEAIRFEKELAHWRAQMPELPSSGDGAHLAGMLDTFEWYLGRPHGQCSGDEQCLMRYYFAAVYPKKDELNVLYRVPQGSEPVGTILCRKGVGTGVNDPGRNDPQPRYFDVGTDATRGNCFGQICPNDAIPPPPAPDGL